MYFYLFIALKAPHIQTTPFYISYILLQILKPSLPPSQEPTQNSRGGGEGGKVVGSWVGGGAQLLVNLSYVRGGLVREMLN